MVRISKFSSPRVTITLNILTRSYVLIIQKLYFLSMKLTCHINRLAGGSSRMFSSEIILKAVVSLRITKNKTKEQKTSLLCLGT